MEKQRSPLHPPPIVLGVQSLGEGVTEGILGVLCSVAVTGFDSRLRKGISYH